ncbi:TlpA family protein disulfide reductase [Pusillimonas caeni]|uniref:TlpA disulfide reductase family protein n=1 Tax=Pusillimonas caeni TaxID=1348472 RepID=UPI000E59CC21|nr:TlpA disulfide reductase family protein [Pusillimonas caeni]TFL14116.1 TlpA family protein disulfide reductase [Pusillimonas caeni]
MIGVGPFSIQVIIVAIALFCAWAMARSTARMLSVTPPKAAGGALFDAAFWGFVAARLGYIALWWKEYSAAPMSMIAIGDGGFAWWAGIPVSLAVVWWETRSAKTMRIPALSGIAAGVVIWVLANSALSLTLRSAEPLPDLQLATLDERPVSLNAYAGRPVVLNLWASWCPPCRREMPVFERAQKDFPGVAFVMINQGESAEQAQDFLKRESLSLADVLLDPSSQAMLAVRSHGLPTTLFYDARGRLVDSHLGEITMPSLKDKMLRRFGQIETGKE